MRLKSCGWGSFLPFQLQTCISFCSFSERSGAFLLLPYSHKNSLLICPFGCASSLGKGQANILGHMFHLELSVDFDRRFSNVFSPQIVFSIVASWPRSQGRFKDSSQICAFLRRTQDKKHKTRRKICPSGPTNQFSKSVIIMGGQILYTPPPIPETSF